MIMDFREKSASELRILEEQAREKRAGASVFSGGATKGLSEARRIDAENMLERIREEKARRQKSARYKVAILNALCVFLIVLAIFFVVMAIKVWSLFPLPTAALAIFAVWLLMEIAEDFKKK